MKSVIICASLLLGLAFQSCSKEESKSREEKLSSGVWNFDSYISSDPDLTIEPCSFDNTLEFMKDGSGEIDEGDVLCPNAVQTEQFTWEFGDSTDELIVTQYGFNISLTILSLSESTMVTYSDESLTVTYKH